MTFIVTYLGYSGTSDHALWMVWHRYNSLSGSDRRAHLDIDCWFDFIRSTDEIFIRSGWIMREQTLTALCLQWPHSNLIRRSSQ